MASPQPIDWNTLAQPVFNARRADGSRHPSAADNVLIAWPELLRQLGDKPQMEILDFGCGTGDFANQLHERGHQVQGIDKYENMVAISKEKYPHLPFRQGSCDQLSPTQSFDAIMAVMVLQFLPTAELEETLRKLTTHLRPGAKLIFAVHNEPFLAKAVTLTDKYATDKDGDLTIKFKDHGRIKLVSRSSAIYEMIITSYGMKKCAEATPPFTQEYLDTYGPSSTEPLDVPKFLIMSFEKMH